MKKDKDIFDRIMEWKILSIFNPFYKKYKEVLLYLFFGGLTTVISIGSYAFFDVSMHMDPMVANIFSWILAVLFAYVTNRIWVFDSNAEDMKGIIQEMFSFFGGRVATLLMEEVILYVGITLGKESIEKILHPEDTHFTPLVAGILVFGLIGKLFLAWWYKRASKRLSSDSFLAYSADSLSDMLSTAGVLVATLVEYFFGWHIDGVMGVIMSLFILWTGYGIMKQAVNDILGSTPDAELYKEIKETILQCPGVYGVHDLIVHDYGPENHFATAHVELDSNLSLVESHELAENVMTTLREKLKVQATIHADPKAVSNPKEAEYQRDLEAAIYRSGLPLSYHDFFAEEQGDTIHISFEVQLKGACRKTDQEIYQALQKELLSINPQYHIEMMVDRNFISGKVYGESRDDLFGNGEGKSE